jgi:S-adenosylmethionine:tRNA ribosyltransferase-isomerase
VSKHPPASAIRIEDFSYELPAGRIASYPLADRDQSRLLVYKNGELTTDHFLRLDTYLPSQSMLVLNNTRVVQARLAFFKDSGARIEVFCLYPVKPLGEVQMALALSSPVSWRCLIGNAKKWKQGRLQMKNASGEVILTAEKGPCCGEEYGVNFSWKPESMSFAEVLEMLGETPLPPYINRPAEASDKQVYQTVFAKDDGSVAAPTAGLHFTTKVFERLADKQISKNFVTLHVGAGTFKPVSASTIDKHNMHQEQFLVDRELIRRLMKKEGHIVCVGTTSMRTLESLYWIGVKLLQGYQPEDDCVQVEQWLPYQYHESLPDTVDALGSVLSFMEQRQMQTLRGETSLIIIPGFVFRMVDILVTNFHQPKSTLLLLVAAFAGKDWKKMYDYALKNDFRFLSYGDSCLIFRNFDQSS